MKKALFVGINAYSDPNKLRGCVNDAILTNQILTDKFGFTESNLKRMLVDESATKENIIDRLQWLKQDAKPGDVLFASYSGHGSQTICQHYDTHYEPDGLDEIICPVDFNPRSTFISDEDFQNIFSDLPAGVNLTVILDSCHSSDSLRDFQFEETPIRSRRIPMPPDIVNRGYGLSLPSKPIDISYEEQKGILLAGCKTNETSMDTFIVNSYHGVFTYYLFDVLRDFEYKLSYKELIDKVNERLVRVGYSAQHPQLNCPKEVEGKLFLDPIC